MIFYQTFKNNSIELIEDDSFTSSSSLISLDLGSNFVNNFTKRTFSGLENLVTLNLSYKIKFIFV